MTHPVAPVDSCPSEFFLDRVDANEVSTEARLRFERHCENCAECRARMEDRQRARRHFDLESPARAPRILLSPGAPPIPFPPGSPQNAQPLAPSATARALPLRKVPAWAWLIPAAAALLLVVLKPGSEVPGGFGAAGRANQQVPEDPAVRAKGGFRLGFFVRRGNSVFRGGHGESLRPGDALQFTVSAPRAGYLAVLSRDGSGQSSVYYPEGKRAAPVEAGEQILPQSTVLDDVLGHEKLHAVLCEQSFELQSVLERVAEGRGAPLGGPGCSVDTIEIEKVPQ